LKNITDGFTGSWGLPGTGPACQRCSPGPARSGRRSRRPQRGGGTRRPL